MSGTKRSLLRGWSDSVTCAQIQGRGQEPEQQNDWNSIELVFPDLPLRRTSLASALFVLVSRRLTGGSF